MDVGWSSFCTRSSRSRVSSGCVFCMRICCIFLMSLFELLWMFCKCVNILIFCFSIL